MGHGMNIGNQIDVHLDKETAENMGTYISTVFKEGFQNRMDQTTIQKAIEMMPDVVQASTKAPQGINITNCHAEVSE